MGYLGEGYKWMQLHRLLTNDWEPFGKKIDIKFAHKNLHLHKLAVIMDLYKLFLVSTISGSWLMFNAKTKPLLILEDIVCSI